MWVRDASVASAPWRTGTRRACTWK
jgi:hypothetical protein